MLIKNLEDLRRFIDPFSDDCPIACLDGNANIEIEYKHTAKYGGWLEIKFPTPIPKRIVDRKIV